MTRTFFVAALLLCGRAYAQEESPHIELTWFTVESEHFRVHYHEGEERSGKLALKIAEEIYGPVTELYDYRPTQKINIVMKDVADYSNGGAYFFDNKIELWASPLDFDLRGTHNWLRNVVTHEFTHIVQEQSSMKFARTIPALSFQYFGYETERRQDVLYGAPNVIASYPISSVTVPSWFSEGTAQFNRHELGYDYWDSHRDMLLRMAVVDSTALSWNAMSSFGKNSLGNELSYNHGFGLVRYIARRFGDVALKSIARDLARATTWSVDRAIKNATGIDGEDLYNQWQHELRESYERRTQGLRSTELHGEIISKEGFANVYPVFSPDGVHIAFLSNKDRSGFGGFIILYDLETKKEEKITGVTYSSLSFSPDGSRIAYAKLSPPNTQGSYWYDIYEYDIKGNQERQITTNLRAQYPSYAPDGNHIAAVTTRDGTQNIVLITLSGVATAVTQFHKGEQVFHPVFSRDGNEIYFDYATTGARDIARINRDGSDFKLIVTEQGFTLPFDVDTRGAVLADSGKAIVYASDATGIFNLYKKNLATDETIQLTNVVGGAFMPAVSPAGDIAYSLYTSGGYKLAYIPHAELVARPVIAYERETDSVVPDAKWKTLRAFNDETAPAYNAARYKSAFSSLLFVPFLRLDTYNHNASALENLKFGLAAFSSEVTGRISVEASAAFNSKFDRDISLALSIEDRFPILWDMGLAPRLTFSLASVSRTAADEIPQTGHPENNLELSFSFLTWGVQARQAIGSEAHHIALDAAWNIYSRRINGFIIGGRILSFAEDYLHTTDFGITYTYNGLVQNATADINPAGFRSGVRADYETGDFIVDRLADGTPVKNPVAIPRVEINGSYGYATWWKDHIVTLGIRAGSILTPESNHFFDFYAGGITGMRGYPYFSIGGNEIGVLSLAYRFPLIRSIDQRIAQLYFDKLYLGVFADYGNAWTGDLTRSVIAGAKRDAGAEFRLETFSFYALPTKFSFAAAYGFDTFTRFDTQGVGVSYGKEMRYYFSLGFSFF